MVGSASRSSIRLSSFVIALITNECRSGAILGREPRSLKDYFRELASR
jgi:hypothetical protein